MQSILSDDTAPSASLDYLKAQAAPTYLRVLPEQLGGLWWPQEHASAGAQHELFSHFQPPGNSDFMNSIQRGWIFQEVSNTQLHDCTVQTKASMAKHLCFVGGGLCPCVANTPGAPRHLSRERGAEAGPVGS